MLFKRILSDQEAMKAEKEKAAMNARLASLGELSAGVGHEINNPLAIIQGAFEILRAKLHQGILTENEMQDKLNIIRDAIRRISEIVDGLRALARMDKNDTSLVNTNGQVEKTVAFLREIYRKEGVDIELDLDASIPCFSGNIGKFQQIILNLLGNAKDAILEEQDGGAITISTREVSHKIVVTVADNGKGIEKENLNRIFDTFYTTKEVGKGTGMGLSIVYSLMEELDGEIEVASKIGKGTSFYLRFNPVKERRENSDLIGNYERTATQTQLKGYVLIVDDEEGIREFLGEVCEEVGLYVDYAVDGLEAYEKIQEFEYDLLITDLKMPRLSGEDLIRMVRVEEGKNMRIAVVTGGVSEECSEEKNPFLAQYAESCITKPFDLEKVHSVLYDLLGES